MLLGLTNKSSRNEGMLIVCLSIFKESSDLKNSSSSLQEFFKQSSRILQAVFKQSSNSVQTLTCMQGPSTCMQVHELLIGACRQLRHDLL